MLTYAYNPSTRETEARGAEVLTIRFGLTVRPCFKNKNKGEVAKEIPQRNFLILNLCACKWEFCKVPNTHWEWSPSRFITTHKDSQMKRWWRKKAKVKQNCPGDLMALDGGRHCVYHHRQTHLNPVYSRFIYNLTSHQLAQTNMFEAQR